MTHNFHLSGKFGIPEKGELGLTSLITCAYRYFFFWVSILHVLLRLDLKDGRLSWYRNISYWCHCSIIHFDGSNWYWRPPWCNYSSRRHPDGPASYTMDFCLKTLRFFWAKPFSSDVTDARTSMNCGGKQCIRSQNENPVMLPYWPYLGHFLSDSHGCHSFRKLLN